MKLSLFSQFLIRSGGLRLLLLLMTIATMITPAIAQESIVAIGKVSTTGNLLNSANTVGGTVSINKGGTGVYQIDITAPGAFSGNAPGDFLVGVTADSTFSNDDAGVAAVDSVNANVLSILVHMADLEDDTDLNNPEPRNFPFFFHVYRFPDSGPLNPSSRYLLATGEITTGGNPFGGVAVNGAEITSALIGSGDYQITLTAPGQFASDAPHDYVLMLSVGGFSPQDFLVRGDVTSTASDDAVVINVHTDDAQDETNDNSPLPLNKSFSFTLYRIPNGPEPEAPASRLLIGLANVQGSNGNLLAGSMDAPGGIVSSERIGEGDYQLTLSAPGRFANSAVSQYSLQLHCNGLAVSDEFANGVVWIPDEDTMHIAVATNDLEEAGQSSGISMDRDFSVVVFQAGASHKTDLRIGKWRNVQKMKGNNLYNLSGAGQRVRVSASGNRNAKYFFAVENDGNVIDDLTVRRRGGFRGVTPKFMQLTGGRKNVTSKVKGPGCLVKGVAPGQRIVYQGKVRFKGSNSRKRRTSLKVQSNSTVSGQTRDVSAVKLRRRD